MDGKPARSVTLTDFEKDAVKHLCLLTMKPVIYVANVAESDLADAGNNLHVKEVMNLASELQSGLVTISAQVWCCPSESFACTMTTSTFLSPPYLTPPHSSLLFFNTNTPVASIGVSIAHCYMRNESKDGYHCRLNQSWLNFHLKKEPNIWNHLVSVKVALETSLGQHIAFWGCGHTLLLARRWTTWQIIFLIMCVLNSWKDYFMFSTGNKSMDHTCRLALLAVEPPLIDNDLHQGSINAFVLLE